MRIVFDIGATKTRLASSYDGDTLGRTVVYETPADYETGIAEFRRVVQILSAGEQIEYMAGGIAGMYNVRNARLMRSNLAGWINHSFKSELETLFNTPVYVENDAAIVGLGEAHQGGGRGFGIVAYITVSTGVGGARIVNGLIDHKSLGFEPGHQIIDADKTMIPGSVGNTLENYISGRGLTQRTGKKPKEIKEAAFWDGFAKVLAYGLNNVCVFWSPDAIVLGGSMITGDPAIPIEKTKKYLHDIVKIYPELPEIKMAELGDFGGLHGALQYIKQQSQN